ncbi:hypothetical protein Clacol_008285 [Clathrus columnatus]|uniref:Uncharacterized protein n=1 Tax=Clathrus columnatus TaxID=1419009 RepID=A0AAV5AKK8_9AGAM|nr:hypothetical protein Clacol_008285 [Clathrus columnatus]
MLVVLGVTLVVIFQDIAAMKAKLDEWNPRRDMLEPGFSRTSSISYTIGERERPVREPEKTSISNHGP